MVVTRIRSVSSALCFVVTCAACEDRSAPGPTLDLDESSIRVLRVDSASLDQEDAVLLTTVPFSVELPEFGDVLDVALGPEGRLVVLDPLGPFVVVLDSTGLEETRFGRDGGGPGEFRSDGLSRVVVVGDTILVPDVVNQRVTRFALSGEVLGSFPIESAGDLTVDWRRNPGGGLVFRRISDPQRLEAVDVVGSNARTVDDWASLSLPPGSVPLAALPVWCVLPDQRHVWGRSDQYRLSVSGEPSVIVQGALEVRPLSEVDAMHVHDLVRESVGRRFGSAGVDPERMRQVLDRMVLPEEAPLIADLVCSEGGELWVQHALSVTEMDINVLRVGSGGIAWGSHVWDVLDIDSERTRRARLPKNARITRVTSDLVVGLATDALGRKTVVRWSRQ